MKKWAVQDAKARFSELLEDCLTHGPQVVTKRGTEAAVLVPIDEWKRLQSATKRSLKDLLLTPEARDGLPLSERGGRRRRTPTLLE